MTSRFRWMQRTCIWQNQVRVYCKTRPWGLDTCSKIVLC